MAKTNSIIVGNNATVKGTKNNDVFHITETTGDATIIAGNKGTDTLHFDSNIIVYYGHHKTGTKDLEVKYMLSGSTDEKTITIKDYFTSTKATDTKSSILKVHYHLGFDHDGSFIDKTEIDNLTVTKKNNTVTGTKFTEVLDYSEVNDKGYIIYAGGGSDIISGTQKNDVIYGQAGDDYIAGCGGSDTITGGTGHNTLVFEYDAESQYTVNLTKGEKFDIDAYDINFGDLDFEIIGKNAKISYDVGGQSGSVILKNFGAKDVTNNAKKGSVDTSYVKLTDNMQVVHDLRKDVNYNVNISKNYSGSYLNERIDASNAGQQYKRVKNKNVKADLAIGGAGGNDTIIGSAFNDIITGGKGTNTVVYDKNNTETFGKDTIKLTKNENTVIDLTALNITHDDFLNLLSKDSKHLYINLSDNERIKLENFTKSNVVGNGSVKVWLDGNLGEENEISFDLNNDFLFNYLADNFKHDDRKKTATITTTRFSETINIADDEYVGYTKTINAGNGTNDVYVYSPGKLNIKTGSGYDLIQVQDNDKNVTINSGNGDSYIELINTTGKNTINAGNGVDNVGLNNSGKTTAKLGNGENIVSILGTGNNTIITGKHNDEIDLCENTATTTIKAGKGTNTISVDDVNFGKVTLVEEKVKATNIINFAVNIDDNYTFKRSGNNLIISNDTSSLTVNDYFLKRTSKTKYANIQFKDYNGDFRTLEELFNLTEKPFYISGSGTITGTDGNDVITGSKKVDTIKALAGNDTITAYAGDDKIYGGKGDDIIDAGKGKNNIYYSLGDGNDTIKYGAGNDTLVFDKGTRVSAVYEEDDLLVTYAGSKGGVNYTNTITILDYKNHKSVKNIKIGTTTKALSKYINSGGNTTNYVSTSADETFSLQAGNNKITFPASADDFGIDKVTTQNTSGNGYTDTLYFPNHSIEDNEIEFWMVDADDPENVDWNTYKDIQVDAWLDNTEHGGHVNFKGLLANHTNLTIQDKNRSYVAKGYFGVQENPIDYTGTTTNSITFVNHSVVADDTVVIKANNKYNCSVIYSLPLEYQYNGGHDYVNSDCGKSDTYKIGQLSTSTSLQVKDSGGSDTITVTNNAADISLICNVYKNGDDWEYVENHFVLVAKDEVSIDSLQAAIGEKLSPTTGLNYMSSQSTITHSFNTNGCEGSGTETTTWYAAIAESVSNWLDGKYNSTAEAIAAYNNDNTIDLTGLINAYKSVDYSTIVS